jgi:hypothetical protein
VGISSLYLRKILTVYANANLVNTHTDFQVFVCKNGFPFQSHASFFLLESITSTVYPITCPNLTQVRFKGKIRIEKSTETTDK